MHKVDIERMVELARKKVAYQQASPLGYVILSVLAGIYLGFGITLIFSVGASFAAAESASVKLVMGASFGIALTLVIFAGSELFTGNTMVCSIGVLSKGISWSQVGHIFLWSFLGNLIGSFGIAWLIVQSGVVSKPPQVDLLMNVTSAKILLTGWELFVRGVLCNWLVCLAVWMSSRITNDTAKILLIFWCLFAFVASGFEHSIANQSIFSMALLLPHEYDITLLKFFWNQAYVGLGNIVGGFVFVGGAYWLTSRVSLVTTSASTLNGPTKPSAFESEGVRSESFHPIHKEPTNE
ncbi:formate/nitrite transporter family protein [Nitrospira sp. M1]